jgi:hypothetical protein
VAGVDDVRRHRNIDFLVHGRELVS